MTRAVLVPLRSFHDAKSRLRDVLDTDELARTLATAVLMELPDAIVVTDDDEVATFAKDAGHAVLSLGVQGLSRSVTAAIEALPHDVQGVLIVHADIARPQGLRHFQPTADVVIVSDHRGDGTPVLYLPRHSDFDVAYGPSSARLHVEEAGRRGLTCHVESSSPWGIDIDEPDDVAFLP